MSDYAFLLRELCRPARGLGWGGEDLAVTQLSNHKSQNIRQKTQPPQAQIGRERIRMEWPWTECLERGRQEVKCRAVKGRTEGRRPWGVDCSETTEMGDLGGESGTLGFRELMVSYR